VSDSDEMVELIVSDSDEMVELIVIVMRW